jgi:hypothetical protein
MATRRKTSTPTGKRKKGGIIRTLILVTITVVLLAAVALSISYFYIKNDRKAAPKLSEINVKDPSLTVVKPTEILKKEPEVTEMKDNPEVQSVPITREFEGTWVSTINGSMLNLNNETFLIDFPSVEKKIPLKGHYVVKGNSITFIVTSDDQSCGTEPGQYTFRIKDKDLILEKVMDNCSKRAKTLEARWFKL